MVAELFVSQRPTCELCGENMAGFDCTCAAEAMWLFRASQGKITTTSCHVRALTADCSGGTRLSQMEKVSAHYGITTGKVYQPIEIDTLFTLVDTGRYGAIIDLSYGPFVGTAYDRFHAGFRGNHADFLSNRGHIAGTMRLGDPGAAGFVDVPKPLLIRAAGLLDIGSGMTLNEDVGSGRCYAYLTPIDPATPTTVYHVQFICRTPLFKEPNGASAGAVTRASYALRRSLVKGLWWYQIIAPTSANNGKWFKPTKSCTKITVI